MISTYRSTFVARALAALVVVAGLLGFAGQAHASFTTSTAVSSSVNPSASNQLVTFLATVTDTSFIVAPTGNVDFKDGATIIGNVVLTPGGGTQSTASFSISTLSLGSHSITATYNGTLPNQGGTSTSGALIQVVGASGATGNNVGTSLHQSTEYVTSQIVASTITTLTDNISNVIAGQFSEGGSPGVGYAKSGSAPPGSGLAGYSVSRGQALTMLAQAAQAAVTQTDAASGAIDKDGKAPKEELALEPVSQSFGSQKPYGAFFMGGYSGIGSSQVGGQFSGSIQNYVGGGDYKFSPNLLVGLALGYETSSLNTSYNAGSLKGSGFTVMPYVAWRQDNLQWDAMIGVSSLGYKIAQNTGIAATGSYAAQRLSFKTNFTANYTAGGFRFSPTVGILSAFEFDNAYIDSTGFAQTSASVRIFRPSAGGTIGYDWRVPQTQFVVSPYAKALVQVDLLHSGRATLTNGTLASETTLSGVLGGGIKARLTDYLLLIAESTYNTIGAANISQWVAMGQVRLDFPF